MTWQEVCERPDLKDLPYRIELNQLGQIVMSPASNEHSFRQSRLIRELLKRTSSGEVLPECSIDTSDGTKVADVVWFSDSFHSKHGLSTPFTEAPEICIEVLSPSNTTEEMRVKRNLYFEQGAIEFWICDQNAVLTFFDKNGQLDSSRLIPDFPASF
ncbi:MAG: Uma2 family endonuclease [Verrucomicrobiales bacterium]|jgi:Uma2 family endonuclease